MAPRCSTSKNTGQEIECECPKSTQKLCRKKTICSGRDVAEIMNALDWEAKREAEAKQRAKRSYVPPRLKLKTCVPCHSQREHPIPMTPALGQRLRFISHCDNDLPPGTSYRPPYATEDMCIKEKCKKLNKTVTYEEEDKGGVYLETPEPYVRHSESNKSLVNVPSPKVSGEKIAAQKAAVEPRFYKPPLPPKAAQEIIQPHTGIVYNETNEFAVTHEVLPGPLLPLPDKRTKRGRHRHHDKRVCHKECCRKKRCGKGRHRRDKYPIGGRKPSNRIPTDPDDVCGLGDTPNLDHAHVPEELKTRVFQRHSLTVIPCKKERTANLSYGILLGSFNMYDNKFGPKSRGKQGLALSVMAYCLAFHYHPKQWTNKLIDNLLDAGDAWYLQCAEKNHDHSAYMGICEVLKYGKKQVLLLNKKRMQVFLSEPEIVGYTLSKDPSVLNLCKGLRTFFKDHRAGVLITRIMKVVIWKDKVCYYLFDPAGRNSKAYSDFASGSAALINVKDIESLTEILLGRTILADQKFVLAPVKVLKMIAETVDDDLVSEPEVSLEEKSKLGYRMITKTTAVCNATLHLGDKCFEKARFRQAIPIAVVAMTYAKISPPNTWYSKSLDKIMRLGNKLYLNCIHPNVLIDLTIDNIPNEINMGPYDCEIIIYRERVKGQLFTTKDCILNINSGLDDFFSHEYNSGILEFSNYAVAVWRQKDMFYLFDPYPRTADGKRSLDNSAACCLMLLNTAALADVIRANWDYLPPTSHFYIHAFKVLKLRKASEKGELVCALSDDKLPGRRRGMLEGGDNAGDFKRTLLSSAPSGASFPAQSVGAAMPVQAGVQSAVAPTAAYPDEEYMGEIVSLMDSIQEEYVPKIPNKYKNLPPEPMEPRIINLDSPTVSVTQVVPPWPKPRDKTGEEPDVDPEYEPTPPPTPPPPPPPEGEEEEAEEEMDEEAMERKKEEEARKRAEEEEERRKLEALPEPMPPPPPTPQSDIEVELAYPVNAEGMAVAYGPDGEPEDVKPVEVTKRILFAQDAKKRVKLRRMLKKMTEPLYETPEQATPSAERLKPNNFKELPDTTEIIRGSVAIPEKDAAEYLPFASITAVILSYKYTVNTWTKGLVNFVVDTSKLLYHNKKKRFQYAPIHVIPKVKIGQQAYHAHIDVVGEGPTWLLEDALKTFFTKYDRGMMTTATYSCAIFERNGLYYLYDGSTCNGMGLRDINGHACLLRFRNVHDLSARILFNKDGNHEDQHFILSRVIVRRLLAEARQQLPEDHDFATGLPKGKKSKASVVPDKGKAAPTAPVEGEPKDEPIKGYQMTDGLYRIEGTTSLVGQAYSANIKPCHFVCLVAMLLATMHPVRTWDRFMVDSCIEKGLEISAKAKNMKPSEKRVVKNILLDGKLINVNIKKIIVINENTVKKMEQYIEAVMNRLRFVIVRFPGFSNVLHRADGVFHVFDPYAPPTEKEYAANAKTPNAKTACWTMYRTFGDLMNRLKIPHTTNVEPEFYTFELTSLKRTSRYVAFAYKMNQYYKPQENPNTPYLKRMKKSQPLIDEKMYWMDIEVVPWSRNVAVNAAGLPKNTPKTLWKSWTIEVPGDLYSLFGSVHPKDERFAEDNRGKQYLCVNVIALVMVKGCKLSAWTGSFLDGIVINGDKYYTKLTSGLSGKQDYEIQVSDLGSSFSDMYPFSFTAKYEKIIFGFVYNIYPDRFNLSKALTYFFEKHDLGLLVSPKKNLAFGKVGISYFVFDCQSFGSPLFCPGQGGAYILKCESINRLIYCMTVALNIRRHGMQFHLYSAQITVSDKGK